MVRIHVSYEVAGAIQVSNANTAPPEWNIEAMCAKDLGIAEVAMSLWPTYKLKVLYLIGYVICEWWLLVLSLKKIRSINQVIKGIFKFYLCDPQWQCFKKLKVLYYKRVLWLFRILNLLPEKKKTIYTLSKVWVKRMSLCMYCKKSCISYHNFYKNNNVNYYVHYKNRHWHTRCEFCVYKPTMHQYSLAPITGLASAARIGVIYRFDWVLVYHSKFLLRNHSEFPLTVTHASL